MFRCVVPSRPLSNRRLTLVGPLRSRLYDHEPIVAGGYRDAQNAIPRSKAASSLVTRISVTLSMPAQLGKETTGGVMTMLILVAPSSLRASRRCEWPVAPFCANMLTLSSFSAATGDQPTVLIQVYEGECLLTKDIYLLVKFELTSIPPAPRGVSHSDRCPFRDRRERCHGDLCHGRRNVSSSLSVV